MRYGRLAMVTVGLTLLNACLCGLGDKDADKDGATAKDGDCNDDDATVFPGATERCDGVDQDCDGRIDDDPSDADTFYADYDRDGFGDDGYAEEACEAPDDFIDRSGDCGDRDDDVNPDASDDTLDEVDNDCNGEVDDGVPLVLDTVSPDEGSVDGGETVTLRGGVFDDTVEVYFDADEAEVLSVNDATITVRTPPHADGLVDVEVRQGDRSDTLANAYLYTEAPVVTGNAVYGSVTYFDYVGDYASYDDELSGYVLVTEPWEATPREVMYKGLALDSCKNDSPGLLLADIPGASAYPTSVKFQGSSGSFTFPAEPSYPWYFHDAGLSTSTWSEGGSFAFVTAKNGKWAATNVANALRFPDAFTLTAPSLVSTTKVPKAISFAWSGGAAGQYVAIVAQLYDSSFNLLDEAICVAKDDGAFTMTSAAWSAWSANQIVWVQVSREGVTDSKLTDGAGVKIAGTYTVLGAAGTK